MRKTTAYLGVVLALAAGLTVLGSVLKQRHNSRHQAARRLPSDDCSLPSQSLQRMQQADTLDTAQRDTLFRHHDFSQLFQLSKTTGQTVQNGFFGPHQQRLEVVFKEVRQDEHQLALFHIRGLTRWPGKSVPSRAASG